jgi:hypothetical protein
MDLELSLTLTEATQLARLEETIERGLKTFVDVGNALLEIRDKRLYRVEHGTFEDYCRERWAISRPRAYQLIEAAEAVNGLSTIVDILPANESQARPLTQLEPEQQREAWARAVETAPEGKLTAAHVQEVVNEYREARAPEPSPTIEPAKINNPALYSSDTPEWYTPKDIIDRVIWVMGGIDLDPCSNSHDAPNVPAAMVFTREDDGLTRDWHGRVYMNPPYGREIGDWTGYLKRQHEAGNVTQAIALVPSRTDTEWFRELRDYPRCFIWGRLKFSESENGAPFPSMLVYFGSDVERFRGGFEDVGDVYVRV